MRRPADDLDLDAELDKILGSSSTQPLALSGKRGTDASSTGDRGVGLGLTELLAVEPSVPTAAEAAEKTLGLGSLGLGSLGAGSFSFTPFARTMPREMTEGGTLVQPAASLAGGRGRSGTPAAGGDTQNLATDVSRRVNQSLDDPTSPSASVDLLLDSLCADLGVSPARGERPQVALLEAVAPVPVGKQKTEPTLATGPPLLGADEVPALGRRSQPQRHTEQAPLHGHRNGGSSAVSLRRVPPGRASESGSDWDDEAEENNGEANAFDCEDSEPLRGQGVAAEDPAAAAIQGALATGVLRPWSQEEASLLRKAVKKVAKSREGESKKIVWEEVSQELGGGRSPRECKLKYTEDYKSHKARHKDGAG